VMRLPAKVIASMSCEFHVASEALLQIDSGNHL